MNFRCIEDTTPFSVNQTTCMVGKNESGKTTILQALAKLNPVSGGSKKYDKLHDYPRRYHSEYAERHPHGEAKVLQTEWALEKADKSAVENEFGEGALKSDKITITKSYEQEGSSWTMDDDEAAALKHLYKKHGLSAEDKKHLKDATTAEDVHTLIGALAEKSEPLKAVQAHIGKWRDKDLSLALIDFVQQRLPKFMYFSQYSLMSGEISINQLKQDQANKVVDEGDEVFLAFLEYAGTNLDELHKAKQFEDLNTRCEAASNKITRQIFEYWSQNRHLKLHVRAQTGESGDPAPFNTGTVVRARVENKLHEVTVPFSNRSAGFIWFFSFLVMFSQVKKKHGNVIILLDEPGLNLHGTAQRDLLRYIKEKLEPEHQVIYSTHSPFMVPTDALASVRTVEDVVRQKGPMEFDVLGTKVGDNVLSTDAETLFPLRGALGYEISQSLFIGEHTLLVEGPSDILYIQAASEALKAQGRTHLDPRWVLCPSGGLDKVHAFVSLFGGNNLHVAVLADYATGQKNKINSLKKSELLASDHIYTVADFCDKEEADIEDLFEPSLFVKIVNGAYGLSKDHKLTVEKLTAADENTVRLVKKAEAYFNVLPSDTPEYSHYTPAYWLIQNPAALAEDGKAAEDTLGRFEKLFQTLNGLLKTGSVTAKAA